MKTGRILSIDSSGGVQVQLSDRVLEARIVSGGAHIGDRVSGAMDAGIQTWRCSLNRTLVVHVQGPTRSTQTPSYATF